MSKYNKIDFTFISSKEKPTIIERGKKKLLSIKLRHRYKTTTKDHITARRIITRYQKINKPWKTIRRKFLTKSSFNKTKNCRRIFDFIDIDTDSRLSYFEFRSWMLLIDRTSTEQEILDIFNDIDRNRDGFIQYKEFRNYFNHDFFSSEPNLIELTALFNEIDINHSGNITHDKLLHFFNQQTTMITKEEAEMFLRTISDNENQNSISLKEFIRAMHTCKF